MVKYLLEGRYFEAEELINEFLNQYSSIRNFCIVAPKENYYQAFFDGLFVAAREVAIDYRSNHEAG